MFKTHLRVVAAALLAAGVVFAQAPPPPTTTAQPQPGVTFKVEVNYVEVDAVVVDSQGNFVRNLEQDDFQVLEDGKPQTISAFSLVDIPIARTEQPLFAPRPIEPDVRTNQPNADGRLYVIALDDLHTHPLRSQLVKKAARQFIEQRMGGNDYAAIVHTSGRIDASQDFTNSKRLLLAAVDKFVGRKLRSSTFERMDEYERQKSVMQPGERLGSRDRIDDPADMERGFHARSALDLLRGITEFLNGVRGRRKALLYISEGIDYDIHDIFNNHYASTVTDLARETIAAATRANVVIYTVDPRGLTSLADEAIEMASVPEEENLGLGTRSFQNELRLAQDSLRALAEETGGVAAVNTNDFSQVFTRIVADNSSYYLLGYYPTNEKRDGRFHRIQVRVNRPGLQVRARKGYAAPRGKASPAKPVPGGDMSPALREALRSPLPVSGLTISVFAAPFKGTAPNASVLIGLEMRGSDIKFAEKDGQFTNDLEVSLYAVDAGGKAFPGQRQNIHLALRPETHARVAQSAFRTLQRLELPPGRYQVHAAARETLGAKVGTVLYDLEVPDFWKSPLAMSGLVITSASASSVPTGRADEQLKPMLAGPPAATREFPLNDELALFAEVYDNEAGTPHRVDISATLQSDDGKVLFNDQAERSSAELQGGRGGYGYAARLPLRGLAPGLYVLKVEARSRLGQSTPVMREIQFRIQPNAGVATSDPLPGR